MKKLMRIVFALACEAKPFAPIYFKGFQCDKQLQNQDTISCTASLFDFQKSSSIELFYIQIEFDKFALQLKQMDRKCLTPTTKRRYAQISIKRRQSFVSHIVQKGIALAKAAKRFNIKLSTAKLIFKKFKETGRFFPKKTKKCALKDAPEASPSENINESDGHTSKQQREEQISVELEVNQNQMNNFGHQTFIPLQPFCYFPSNLCQVPPCFLDYYY